MWAQRSVRSRAAAVLGLMFAGLWAAPVHAASPTALYEVTFDATWSGATHPDQFPPGPHFSGLVGGTHAATVIFWEGGETASAGIERMAEQGAQQTLANEINQAINAGTAESVILGGGIGRSPGAVSVEFTASQAFPQLTLVSMVAPSPDWFVGVAGLPLFDGSGWTQEMTVDLLAYDAGTDSGPTYLSPNADTDPQDPIALIEAGPLGNGVPVGSFHIRRLDADPIPVLPAHALYFLAFALTTLLVWRSDGAARWMRARSTQR